MGFGPMPEGYQLVEASQLDACCFAPPGQAVIWLTSAMGQKICLLAGLNELNAAVQQIIKNERQFSGLRAISGEKSCS
jgi:hypothetical protein